MPRTETVLQVFVASPNDLAEEREDLESLIRELNLTWSKNLGLRLDLIRWETHSYPGIGHDSQSVINDQIGDDYDIFVGIMGVRFGTANERAGSGTAEEFERAYKKYKENPDGTRIMFYFKDAPVVPSETDLSELARVQEFRNKLGELGTLHWSFKERGEFVSLARLHLSRQMQEWKKSWGVSTDRSLAESPYDLVEITVNQVQTESDLDDEEGFLDIIEQGEEHFNTVNEVLLRMTSEIENLGGRMTERTAEMNQITTSQQKTDIKSAKRVIRRASEDMDQYVVRMQMEIPGFSQSYSKAIDSVARAASLSLDFTPDDKSAVSEVLTSVRELRSQMGESLASVQYFHTTIATLPRITTGFNRSKRRAQHITENLINEMIKAQSLTLEVEKVLEELVQDE